MEIKKELIKRNIAGDTVLVPVGKTVYDANGLFILNEVGAFLWDALPQAQNEEALVDRLLEEEPLLRRNYLCYLTGRVRFLSGRLQSLSQNGTEGKLVRYLLTNGQSGSFTCSASDLAHRLGISRASLYRAFRDLEAGGVIRREGKTILIPSLSALEGYCKL